jgi:hypothetical protein
MLTFGSGFFIAYALDASAGLHSNVVMPIVRATMDAEDSHRFAINFLKWGWFTRPTDKRPDTENLEVDVSRHPTTPGPSDRLAS